ncbi:hypothetical protein KR084_008896, partial [Drosophila pseudotakahashii]
ITPMEAWNGKKPSISHLKVFGSFAVALDKGHQRSKFQQKGKEYRMVGYSRTAKGYRLYDPNTGQVIEKRDVLFDKRAFDPTAGSISFDLPQGNGTPELQVEDEIDSKDLISNGEGKPCSSGYDRSEGESKDA